MNSKALWWILLVAWITGSVYWHVCVIRQLCDVPLEIPVVAVKKAMIPLTISDGSALNLRSSGNFSFAGSGIVANRSAVQAEIDSLASYIKTKNNKVLTITGMYASDELNSTTFPDLGIARANGLKHYLVGKGLADSLIILKSQLNNDMAFHADSLSGGISISIQTLAPPPSTEHDLANAQKYEGVFKPLDLYFPTASSDYIVTEENQKFLIGAKKFLSENSDKKLLITGYTDNEDSQAWNLSLSQKRALVVKKQFVAAGIAPDRIVTTGKGEQDPKASNDTPEGKRANRRVTVVIQ